MFRRLSLVLFLLFVSVSSAYSQRPIYWKDKTGAFQVKATFLSFDKDTVKLKAVDDGREIEVPFDRLGDEAKLDAKRCWFDLQDKKQFEMVRDHFGSLFERPDAVGQLLLELHKLVPESPYAGMWAAVSMAAGKNDTKAAYSTLKDVVRRIEAQRAVDPARHSMTLASAYNNLAICQIKEWKGDQAAGLLCHALNSSRLISPTIRQNAETLSEIGSGRQAILKVSSNMRQKLLRELALKELAGVHTDKADGWYYALDFDLPSNAGAATYRVEGLDPPRADAELVSMGTGFVVSPGIVLTSRSVIDTTNTGGRKLVTVGVKAGAQFNTRLASKAHVTSSRRTAITSMDIGFGQPQEPSPTVSGWTMYRYIHPTSGIANAELAALEVPGLSGKPLIMVEQSPGLEEEVAIVGFVRGPDIVKRGLSKEAGEVLTEPGINLQQLCTNKVRGGNRGAPLINAKDLVVGIAFDTPEGPTELAGGAFFGARAIRSWFYKNVQTAQLPAEGDAEDVAIDLSQTDSIVPVFVWAASESHTLFSQVANSATVGSGCAIRDHWCLACRGRGVLDCVNSECHHGTVAVKIKIQVGNNPFNGSPIYADAMEKQACDTCNGRGGAKCRQCTGGKI